MVLSPPKSIGVTQIESIYRDLKKFRAPLNTLLFLLPLRLISCGSSVSIPAGCCSDFFLLPRPKLPTLPLGNGGFSRTNRALSDPIKLAALSLATTARPDAVVEHQCAGTGKEDVDGDRRRG